MKIMPGILIVSIFTILLLTLVRQSYESSCTADSCTVDANSNLTISKYIPSILVNNTCAKGLYVPLKTQDEFDSFRNSPVVSPCISISTGASNCTCTATPNVVNMTVTACTPYMYFMKDTSTGDITGRVWDMGNGITRTMQNVTYTYNYTAPGTYTVKLTESFCPCSPKISSGQLTQAVTIPSPGGLTKAFFVWARVGVNTIQFTDASGGGAVYWYFQTGDGKASFCNNPKYKYSSSGSYTVKLSTQDSEGHWTYYQTVVTVN